MPARLFFLALAILIPFGVAVAVLSSIQASLIFPVQTVRVAPVPADAAHLEISSAEGTNTLVGLHFAPPAARQAALVLGFGGNGWNAIDTAETLRALYPNDHVVVFFYRGYPPSTGRPSAEALIADAPRAYDEARRVTGAARVLAAGFSIGSGVAATLATERAVDGLILVTPFDSLGKVVGDQFPWLPVGLLFHHDIDAATALAKVEVPTAIVAAANDEVISRTRTDGLRQVARRLVLDRTISGVGHNDIYQSRAFTTAMREARALLAVEEI